MEQQIHMLTDPHTLFETTTRCGLMVRAIGDVLDDFDFPESSTDVREVTCFACLRASVMRRAA